MTDLHDRKRQEPGKQATDRLEKMRKARLVAEEKEPHYDDVRGKGKHPFTAGADLDEDAGEIRTKPFKRDDGPPPDADVLEQFDLDPEVWEVVARRKSLWQQREDGPWLEAHKVSVRRRNSFRSALSPVEIEALLKPYSKLAARATPRRRAAVPIMAVPIGDLQVGKIDGGGSEALIERFAELTNKVADQIKAEGKLEKLVCLWLGDCVEGIVSQGGRLATRLDLSVTEQQRVYRRLMMHQIGLLAPLADELLVIPIPGNHDQTTRQFATAADDSWALEGASAVQDGLALAPEEFGHVKFRFPDEGEMTTAVNIGTEEKPFIIAATHGHVVGSNPNLVTRWWDGQAGGRQPAGEADILFSAHWHHLRVEFTGGNRTWIQTPALDGGSLWYQHKTGDQPPAGMMTLKITPDQDPGWRDLTVHSPDTA